jgi:predicted peptidase
VLTAVYKSIDGDIGGYWIALPALYDSTNTKYPILFWFHGSGQVGTGNSTDIQSVLNEGIPKLLKAGTFPPSFAVNGKNFSFIILAPQFRTTATDNVVNDMITFAKNNYRVDPTRIYMCGFSFGGRVIANFAGDFPSASTAIVPISGAFTNSMDRCKGIATANLPIWSFHNTQDEAISDTESINFVAAINQYHPAVHAKLTLFPTSDAYLKHDAWTKATDPNYTEGGMNIYQWMLQYSK